MRIIGLDLSLTATGIAHVHGETETVKTNEKHGDRRLLHIQERVRLAAIGADFAVIENLPPREAFGIKPGAMVHGVVRTQLMTLNVPYALIDPNTLKAFATGKGTASKTDMAMAAFKRIGREFDDDNQCDAWWLRAAGLNWTDSAEFELPQAQRDKLKTKGAIWPTGIVTLL